MITMREIDDLRGELALRKKIARDPSLWPRIRGEDAQREVAAAVARVERAIERALAQWWAQGCKATPQWDRTPPCSEQGCVMCICEHPDCTAYKPEVRP